MNLKKESKKNEIRVFLDGVNPAKINKEFLEKKLEKKVKRITSVPVPCWETEDGIRVTNPYSNVIDIL